MAIPFVVVGGGTVGYWLTRPKKNISKKLRTRPPADCVRITAAAPKKRGVASHEFSFLRLVGDIRAILRGDGRQQHLSTLEEGKDRAVAANQASDLPESHKHQFYLTLGTVVTALIGGPIFSAISIVGIFYLYRDIALYMLKDFKRGRILNVFLANLVVIAGMIFTGHLVLAAMAGLVGNFVVRLIEKAERDSRRQLVSAFSFHPRSVWVKKGGVEVEVELADLAAGDLVIVNAGEVIPVDGAIQTGFASVDQQLLTGESQPVERAPGDKVLASTLLISGRIEIAVETAGDETVAARIGQVLDNTQSYTDTLVIRGKNIADGFLAWECGLGAITWLLKGKVAALTVLWSSFGGNMVSLGPMTVLSYLQICSRKGILIKDGRVLESLRKIDTLVFDKTGTLTLEQPTLAKIHRLADIDEETLLGYAATAEYRQPHPIGKAIVDKARSEDIPLHDIDAAAYEVGYGIKVTVNGKRIMVGSVRLMEREGIPLPPAASEIQRRAEEKGYSLVCVSVDGRLGGILEMHPTIRPEAVQVIAFLKRAGKRVYIISGDHEHATRNMARMLGIEDYFAGVLPEEKAGLVRALRDQGRFVCFVGDGINDAIALKSAQVSISLKGASTAATDTAQIILMDGTLRHLTELFTLADEFERTMHANLLTTIVPGAICVSGVYFLHFTLPFGLGLYYLGSAAGLITTIKPVITHQQDSSESDE